MLKNYFKIAIRNLFKHKTFSIINILGLAIGIASFLLIVLWIQNEFKYDQFHSNTNRLYKVWENQKYSNGNILTVQATPGPLQKAIEEEVPEVSMAARSTWTMQKQFKRKNTTSIERGRYADDGFFQLFSFPFIEGDVKTALEAPENIVISKNMADKYFSDEDALGQLLEIIGDKRYKVTGIMEDIPDLSSFKFDYILPFKGFEADNEWLKNWGNNGIFTWVLLKKQATLAEAQTKIVDVLKTNDRQSNVELFLQPVKDMHLYTDYENGKYAGGGKIENVRMFGLIALLIILIACINFMNLSTARSRTRAKEIGLRKVIGAKRISLIYQFFIESFTVALVAVLMAILIVDFCLPYFNNLIGGKMFISYQQPFIWLLLGGIFLVTGLLSGSYPALLLSGFKPIEVLTSRFKGKAQKDYFRQFMVVGQFAIAIFLIIGTGVVFNQLRYMQQKDLGYNKEQLLYIPVETETLRENYTLLKDRLLGMPEILSVSSGVFRLSMVGNSTNGIDWEGKNPEENQLFVSIGANYDILKTIDAKILGGRDFSVEYGADSLNFIINEAAAKAMGMEDPIGQRLGWGGDNGQIVGLVKDFHISPLRYSIDPAIIYIDPDMNQIFVKLETKEIAAILDKLEDLLSIYNPNYPFDYSFASDDYARLYRSEQRVSKLSGIFAVLAIFVCCLGLFGLALFTTEQRTREIGIRKVLGASVAGIVGLLSRDFLKLVSIALLVAVPLAWYFSNQWLQDFYYKIDTPWMMFLLAGGLSVLIAFITVSIQSVKAALANPIESLKNE